MESLKDLLAMSTFHDVGDEIEEVKNDPGFSVALKDQCKYLGINPETQPQYVWIAEESMLAPLPKGWVCEADENGTPFYHNSADKRSQWEHPCDEHYRAMLHKFLREDSGIENGDAEESGMKVVELQDSDTVNVKDDIVV